MRSSNERDNSCRVHIRLERQFKVPQAGHRNYPPYDGHRRRLSDSTVPTTAFVGGRPVGMPGEPDVNGTQTIVTDAGAKTVASASP